MEVEEQVTLPPLTLTERVFFVLASLLLHNLFQTSLQSQTQELDQWIKLVENQPDEYTQQTRPPAPKKKLPPHSNQLTVCRAALAV